MRDFSDHTNPVDQIKDNMDTKTRQRYIQIPQILETNLPSKPDPKITVKLIVRREGGGIRRGCGVFAFKYIDDTTLFVAVPMASATTEVLRPVELENGLAGIIAKRTDDIGMKVN